MPTPYVPPGVTIAEQVQPQVVPLVTSTAEIVLVGLSLGYTTRTDQIVLEGTGAVKLPFLESLKGSKLSKILSVYSVLNPSEGENEGKGFKETTDWKENKGSNSIERVGAGKIKEKTLVNITYQYIPSSYYSPVRLFNLAEVQNRFGNGLTEKGVIESPLSFAAQKALENGASSVILQPLFKTSTGEIEYSTEGTIKNAEQPLAADNANPKVWSTTLQALNAVELIDLLVPVIGQSQESVTDEVEIEVFQGVQGYQQKRTLEQQYFVAVYGEDSSSGEHASPATIRTHAGRLRSYAGGALAQQSTFVNTANFGVQLPGQPTTISVGGQYMAAAVAGALASRPASASLTRKGITGFASVRDLRTPAEKNKDAENGLLVIEQVTGGLIRCRHAITIDNEHGSARSELSVVRAKYNMIESVRTTLENQIIGQIIADANSPVIVRSAISAVLSALQQSGQIVSFTTPICQLVSLEPTKMTAAFSYRPAFTLNYIEIKFALDLSNQTVTVVEKSGS